MGTADRGDEATRHVWTIGSYADIAPDFLSMGAHLVDALDVEATDEVLDVGCGPGNVALTAARRGASVTGVDITPAMLEDARANAAIAGYEDITWEAGDATDLPYDAERFDVVASCVGHMFATPADAAATELLRVTRPTGRIGFTAWTPDSVVPAMARVLADYTPPEPDPGDPPFSWGDPAVVTDRLGDAVTYRFETGAVNAPAMSPAHYWESAAINSGLFIVALDAVDDADRPALREAMIDTIEPYYDDATNAVTMTYRLTVATRD